MCSITTEAAKVGSSDSHMRGPGIGCWFSDRSKCSQRSFEAAVLPVNPNLYSDQWEPIVMYHFITLLVVIQLCSPHRWELDSTTVVQGINNHSRGLYCRRCYCFSVCRGRSSRIFYFSRWLGQLSTVLSKHESPHTGYTFTPWVVSYTPPSRGRRHLDFTSHPKDDGEPWEQFSESRSNSLTGVVFRNRVPNLGHPSKYWPCRMAASKWDTR